MKVEERAPREVCQRCRRPKVVCWCGSLPSIETRTRVIVLQHPRERDVPIGTARMASLCLANAELHVGVDWDASPVLARALEDGARPAILLYPGEGAIDVTCDPPRGPVTLVVVDGTWWQARKLVRTSAALRGLPRYAFVPPRPSEYRIRKEPDDAYVSTIEALVHVLGALEGDPARFLPMLAPFRRMIDAQLAYAGERRVSRQKRARLAKPKGTRVPRVLVERGADLVCVIGEANSWPYMQRTHPDEIVRWLAYRPSTGEILDLVARPRNPLAPRTVEHLDVTERALSSGLEIPDVLASWRAFVRDTDVVCSWTKYGARLFASEGAFIPSERVDLRDVARVVDAVRPRSIEEYARDTACAGPIDRAWPGGRGGSRLACLASIVARFQAKSAAVAPPAPPLYTRVEAGSITRSDL